MSGPGRAEAHRAMRASDSDVVILGPDGFEGANPSNLDAGLADPERSVVVLEGEGWLKFEHLVRPENRLTEPEPTTAEYGQYGAPLREVEDGHGLHEFSREWDPAAGEYVWRRSD